MCWQVAVSPIFNKKFVKYEKKHEVEAQNAYENHKTYLGSLRQGTNPMQITAGWIRLETSGSIAVTEKGPAITEKGSIKTKPNPTRLYMYPDTKTKTLWLITIGDKKSQSRTDMPYVEKFIKQIRSEAKND